MRFCMITTFYPPYHFGGDAIYVQRLSDALADRGHHVNVIHDRDAYYLAQKEDPSQSPPAHPNVHVHGMKSRLGPLSPLLTHQTARPWLKPAVRQHLESEQYDVVHFHNPSLIGSAAFRYGSAVKLYTLHEHWLICPMHVLWKFGREACDRPQCLSCCVRGGRPPQLWRYTGRLARDLRHIDRFISPSRFTRDRHQQAGLNLPISILPHFVPSPTAGDGPIPHPRPYYLFVGRLVKLKGVAALVDVFRRYTDADLLIAGDGEEASALRTAAVDLPNVRFVGTPDRPLLERLYHHALALLVPSLAYEVFGIVLIEAFAAGTPVIARKIGGMPELIAESGGGFTFTTDDELIAAMRTLHRSPDLRRNLGEAGRQAYLAKWTETAHLEGYLGIVDQELRRKAQPSARRAELHA